jgi:pyruvate dehydrogenase E2 component (dihydrolipoamide acetyltransferase)
VPGEIHGLVIPKYGMVMTEGVIAAWHAEVGDKVEPGDELVDIETEKVANTYESPHSGVLRRKLVAEGQALSIGALFGVIAGEDIPDGDIDAFIAEAQASFVAQDPGGAGPLAEFIDMPGGHLRFLKKGDGQGDPVVLVHGFSGDLNSWLLNHDVLAESRTVYALDLPGHGGSSKNPALASVADMAAAVEALLDARGLPRAHLVGHSLGGAAAAAFAIQHPERAASLTLLSPAGLGKEINADFIGGIISARARKEMSAVLAWLFADPALVSRDMTMNALKANRIDGALECLRAISAASFKGAEQAVSLREGLSTLPLPVQVIWGATDRIIPAEHARNLPAAVGVHLIPHAGHMAHMEKAGEVNKLIQQFVNTH